MTGHVFVSYDRDDAPYVHRLVEFLTGQGIAVWFDRATPFGESWANLVEERIESCAAFVVVMSPRSRASEWVTRELNVARRRERPILPLLLDGEPFFALNDANYADVRGGRMPPPEAMTQLRSLVAGNHTPADRAATTTSGTLRVRWKGASFCVNTPVVVSVDGEEVARHRAAGPMDVSVPLAPGAHTVGVEIDRPVLRRPVSYGAVPVAAGATTEIELRFSFVRGRFEDQASIVGPTR